MQFKSNELYFTNGERSHLALKYFKGKAGQVSVFLEKHQLFPLLCGLCQNNNYVDIKSFVQKPFDFYKEEIDYLLVSDCEKDQCKVLPRRTMAYG